MKMPTISLPVFLRWGFALLLIASPITTASARDGHHRDHHRYGHRSRVIIVNPAPVYAYRPYYPYYRSYPYYSYNYGYPYYGSSIYIYRDRHHRHHHWR